MTIKRNLRVRRSQRSCLIQAMPGLDVRLRHPEMTTTSITIRRRLDVSGTKNARRSKPREKPSLLRRNSKSKWIDSSDLRMTERSMKLLILILDY
jgi:hypothetical protein